MQILPAKNPLALCLAWWVVLWGQTSSAAETEQPFKLTDQESGLEATVVILPPAENRGFGLVDVPVYRAEDNIRTHWRSNFVLMCNGGFFNSRNFGPAAFCRIGGSNLGPTIVPRWSGLLAIDLEGRLHLLWRTNDVSAFPSVLQTGPYLIDPGGKIGIKSRADQKDRRTAIGLTEDKELVILITQPIHLYDLAYAIKRCFPRMERCLNLDGGPSTGFKMETVEILNQWPVRNYVVKKKEGPPPR